jgi:hypothetical protein
MKGIPDIAGLTKADVQQQVDTLKENGDDFIAECAVRSMLFLQHIKRQFKQGKIKNGNNLVTAFESGLAALNDDD